jgi:hypothetical protein
MPADMTEPLFEKFAYGKAALKKMGAVPENFRLYSAELRGKHPNYHGMQLHGAEFRAARTGPNKGKLCIEVDGSERTAYVSMEEIEAEEQSATC